MFWDEDIQPEGYSALFERGLGGAGALNLVAGHCYLVSNGWGSAPFENENLQ